MAVDDKTRGKAKEVFGVLTVDGAKKEEGRAWQSKAAAEEEVTQEENIRRAQDEARQAERKRKTQEVRDKGLLGSVTDSLSGRDRGPRP